MTLRHHTANILHRPESPSVLGRRVNLLLAALIFLNVVAMVIDTVPSLPQQWHDAFAVFETVSFVVFAFEYVARIWSIVELEKFRKPVTGRLRFALRVLPLVDLLALLSYFAPFDLRFLRLLRVVRLLRVLHLTEYDKPMRAIGRSIRARKKLLVISFVSMMIMIFFAASAMYFIERHAQPKAFASIPDAMWWAVMTLTTVGYGDVYPITPLGKFFAAVIATCGIAVFALPMAIITAAILEVNVDEEKRDLDRAAK
jgi:voltage-gated potassium channel